MTRCRFAILPRAHTDQRLDAIGGNWRAADAFKRMVERSGKLDTGIEQGSIEIETDNVERELCHIAFSCPQILETATICF